MSDPNLEVPEDMRQFNAFAFEYEMSTFRQLDPLLAGSLFMAVRCTGLAEPATDRATDDEATRNRARGLDRERRKGS